jgi:hypothetical protein
MSNTSDVAARLERWHRTGDPGDLWPGLEEAEFRAAMAEIGGVTRAILADHGGDAVRLRPVATARGMGVAAFASGMGALLGWWLEQAQLAAPPEHAELLAKHLARGRARAGMLERGLMRVWDVLASRGIRAALLKGMHTGRVYFPEPGTRPAADIDLLVERSDFEPARAALAHAGYREGLRSPESPRAEWFPPDGRRVPRTVDMEHEDNPWAIDLHGSLDRVLRFGIRAGFGSPRLDACDAIACGGRRIHVLPPSLLLAWLAFHAASHLETGQLVRYVELVLVIRRDVATHLERWDDLLRLVDRADVGRWVYSALELADRLAPGSVPLEVRERLRRSAPWLTRRVVARLDPAAAQQLYRKSLDIRFMWLGSARESLRFARLVLRDLLSGTPVRALVRRVRLLLRGRLSLRARG